MQKAPFVLAGLHQVLLACEAVDDGDADAVETRSRELSSWLDRAAANGALHRNTVARRKAQAARLVAGEPE